MNPASSERPPHTSPDARRRDRRRRELILPAIQLRLIAHFAIVATFALVLQFLLFSSSLTRIAAEVPREGRPPLEDAVPALTRAFLISFLGLLPLVLLVGVAATFRIAGPLTRIRMFFEAMRRGEGPPDCRLRNGDHLHELCDLMNEVTRPLREEQRQSAAGGDREQSERPAA